MGYIPDGAVLLDGAGLDVPGIPPHRLPPPAGLHHRAQEDLVEMITELPAHTKQVLPTGRNFGYITQKWAKKVCADGQVFSEFF
jgi:hypothetical protein